MKQYIPAVTYLTQYVYELKSWERLLSFQKEELVCFKNRLAEVLNSSTETEMILAAERFQEEFLAQERIVYFLLDELKLQSHILEKESCNPGEFYTQAANGQAKLRREIKEGEEAFATVKKNFEQFLQNKFVQTS